MKLSKWLVVTHTGGARVVTYKPDLKANEIVIHLLLEIPDVLFARPTIEARVVVPNDAAPPLRLDAEVLQQVDDAIRNATGLQVILSVAEPDEKSDV